ncbi:MAG: ABC transporter ATP-binding protein, partial [Gemmatimonadales bacterium]
MNALSEAATLAIVAQVAAALVKSSGRVNVSIGTFAIHSSVTHLLVIGFAVSLLRLALQWPLSTLPARISSDVQANLRKRVFRAFADASWGIQSQDREGALQEVMTNQTTQATQGAVQATALVTASITFVIMMASALALSPLAGLIVFAVATSLFFVLSPVRSLSNRRARELSAAQVRYAGGIAEANRLAEESQVFGVTESQHDRVIGLVEACRRLFYRAQLILKMVPNLYQALIFLVLMVGLWALHHFGTGGKIGSLGAIVLLLLRGAQNGQFVQTCYQTLQQTMPFLDRLREAERRYADSALHDAGRELARVTTLGFDDVSFAYTRARPVLEGVSFTVAAGEAIGIVGPSGAGKSTLVQVLLRLREPSSGRYLVNGENVTEFARADWTRLVAYVPQEPRLLHASVIDNVRFFRHLDDEAIVRACKLARIHEDIETWPNGYETVVGPRADAVSGGQQQRLCLARALAARPAVLVLDEPTSALDPHSETLIQESLTALKHELTLFTIAHRMSTLDMCDRVMVILEGRMVAFDTKAVLQEQNAYYRSASMIAA